MHEFASQFWDGKEHPTKASQHEFPATCMFLVTSRGMCAPMESQPLWKSATMTTNRIQNNE